MQDTSNSKLIEFVEASKQKGASDESLTSVLRRKGWSQEDIDTALGEYWERSTGLVIPERRGGGESARDAFLYLLSFGTLATWAGALGSMLFRLIEYWFPDPVARVGLFDTRLAVTWQMASIAVGFPIYLFAMRTIFREARDEPGRLQSGVRKWLTYIALLLTAVAVIGDLIWFLNYFLNGGLTVRFVLKALTVLSICGAIFSYYLGSLRWNRNTNVQQVKRRSIYSAAAAGVIVVIAFCVGLGVAGTPSQQRKVEADRRRVEDLRRIALAVNSWFLRNRIGQSTLTLPSTLADLRDPGLMVSQPVDPETKAPYEYRVISGNNYELCATFFRNEHRAAPSFGSDFWQHGKGHTCFKLNASAPPIP